MVSLSPFRVSPPPFVVSPPPFVVSLSNHERRPSTSLRAFPEFTEGANGVGGAASPQA